MADLFRARVEQRRRALDDGLDLLGWHFDPLDSAGAHVTIAQLGAIVQRAPTDDGLLIAEWWIRLPHVERRLASVGKLTLRARDAADAPVVRRDPESGEPAGLPASGRLWLEVPLHADESWRAYVLNLLATLLARGYRIVDFVIDNPNGVGHYLLAEQPPPEN